MVELAPGNKRGLSLAGPVINAAGVLGFAGEYRGLLDFSCLGAFVTNPLTETPRTPAHPPNAVELVGSALIHTGLPNPGVRAALRRYGADWRRLGPPVIVHLAATRPDEVRRAVERLERAEGVSGVELGLRDEAASEEAAQMVRAAVGGPPLIVRLPLVSAEELAAVVARAGADALTVAAPPRGSARVGERRVTGRLYGPGNFAAALATVQAVVNQRTGLPVIGSGGIFSAADARAMLEAGAVAVQIDAAAWNDPGLFGEWSGLFIYQE